MDGDRVAAVVVVAALVVRRGTVDNVGLGAGRAERELVGFTVHGEDRELTALFRVRIRL